MNRSLVDHLAWTIALLLSGLAAGMFLMDCIAYYPVLPRLSDHAALEVHQQALALRRTIFRLTIAGSGSASIVLLIFFSDVCSRRWLVGQLACLVALIVYTNWALIPLNREIAAWQPGSPPDGWKLLFSRMIALERQRSFVPAVAFGLALVAYVVRRTPLPR